MVDPHPTKQSKTARWGLGILLVVSALFGLNGVGWIFFGPNASLSNMADNMGVSVTDLESAYPMAANAIGQEARRVAVYLAAIGAMGFIAALAGLGRQARWSWHITWVLIATLVALFLIGLAGGLGPFGATSLGLAVLALIGQLLARTERT
jgi:hypothetical protein